MNNILNVFDDLIPVDSKIDHGGNCPGFSVILIPPCSGSVRSLSALRKCASFAPSDSCDYRSDRKEYSHKELRFIAQSSHM